MVCGTYPLSFSILGKDRTTIAMIKPINVRPFSITLFLLVVTSLSWPFQIAYFFLGKSYKPILLISMIMVAVATYICGKWIFRDGFANIGWSWGKPKYYIYAVGLTFLLWIVPSFFERWIGWYSPMEVNHQTIAVSFLFSFLITLLPAFSEEFGWRGYLLPRLFNSYHPKKALLLHGLITWIWHLPFLIIVGLEKGGVVGVSVVLAVSFIPTVMHAVVFAYFWSSSESLAVSTLYHASFDEVRDVLQDNIGLGPLGQNWQMLVLTILGFIFLYKVKWNSSTTTIEMKLISSKMTKREFIKTAIASGLLISIVSEGHSEFTNAKIQRRTKSKMKMKPSNFDPQFIEIIKDATKAPSGHNTQPWKFKIDKQQIVITPDFTKRLIVVDPDDHALFVSLGCALENLLLSAKVHGYSPKVKMNFTGDQNEIIVDLLKNGIEQKDVLYDYIVSRQSTRNEYDTELIPKALIDQLKASNSYDEVEIIFFTEKEQINRLKPYIMEGSDRQFNNKEFVNELVSWIRFNEKTAKKSGDGLWAPCTGSPNVPKFIGKIAVKNFTSAKSEAKRWGNLINKSAGFALFVARDNSKDNWVKLGQSFQRFGLRATRLNIKHAHANMPCEELEVRKKLIKELNLGNRHPLLLVRFGYAEKMPYSFRRPVDEVLC